MPNQHTYASIEDRFWSKVDTNGPIPEYAPHLGPCWIWTASTNDRGYGQFWDGQSLKQAHRWLYGHLHGPIPAHLDSDHLCRVHPCVRDDHIEPVTRLVNILRGDGSAANTRRAVARTHCSEGHAFTPENTAVDRRYRYCKECHRVVSREYRRRHRVSA